MLSYESIQGLVTMRKKECYDGNATVWGMMIGMLLGLVVGELVLGIVLGAGLGLLYELTQVEAESEETSFSEEEKS